MVVTYSAGLAESDIPATFVLPGLVAPAWPSAIGQRKKKVPVVSGQPGIMRCQVLILNVHFLNEWLVSRKMKEI